jgi:mono/diheme cytochrome c family protein
MGGAGFFRMILAVMARPLRLLLLVVPVLALGACGTQKVAKGVDSADQSAAHVFNQRCGGCHTLSYAATHGSAADIRTRERTDGPNFNTRKECTLTRVLYAIRNGGFSGAIMPQNIVVGPQAVAVAKFIVKYSGRKTPNVSAPGSSVCASGASTAGGGAAGTTPSGP